MTKTIWSYIQAGITALGGYLGFLFGGVDALFKTLVILAVIDYLSGLAVAYVEKTINSQIGFRGIFRKLAIFALVAVANVVDQNILCTGAVLRTAAIFFYISNEGISILENAGKIGVPIPQKLKDALAQIRTSAGEDRDDGSDNEGD